jgi:hypothetical protein
MGASATVPAAPTPKVAVIAVHGVAYHEPGASANAMADLLLSLPTAPRGAARSYSSFDSQTIHMPLQPTRLEKKAPAPAKTLIDKMFAFLQERSVNFATLLDAWTSQRGKPAHGVIGHEFMRLLLQDYPGGADGDTYVTARLEGKRAANAPGGEANVHVYEAYWADLARPQNSLLSFFQALFQLLLHLGSLSRLTIDASAAENVTWIWRVYRTMQKYAVRMLQIPIPLLNVILFIAAFSVLPRQLVDPYSCKCPFWLPLVGGGIAGLVAGFLLARHRQPWWFVARGPLRWALMPVAAATLGVGLAAGLVTWLVSACSLAALEWWLVGAALFKYVLDKYDDIRAGTKEVGWGLYALAFIVFCVNLRSATSATFPAEAFLSQTVLWTMQCIMVALRISWIGLFSFAFLACAFGSLAWRTLPAASPERARARAAVRTSRLALALPTLLVLLLVIFLWGGVFHWATTTHLFPRQLFAEELVPSLPPGGAWLKIFICDPADVKTLVPRLFRDAKGQTIERPASPNDYFAASLVWSVGPGLTFTLVLMVLGFFLLTWWALPAVLTETFPPRDRHGPPRSSTNDQSLHLGLWLSRGLDATSIVTVLIWSAIFLVPSSFFFLTRLKVGLCEIKTMNCWSDFIVDHTGRLTASLAVLALIVRYSSSALGIVLDVDNYLRGTPAWATPRAKIAERYVSLLRYIAGYRGPDRRGYDSVVIVAHSLGSLISADVLRFLKQERDPALTRLGYGDTENGVVPVRLFTMGNPLRQLLNRFFPYLYDWVRTLPDNGLHPLPPGGLVPLPPPIPSTELPDPGELGVQAWLNSYRSGDYVGRSLWTGEWYGRTSGGPDAGAYPEPIHAVTQEPPPPINRSEACIGAGAHQHYWDDTAPDIAEQLDGLIR